MYLVDTSVWVEVFRKPPGLNLRAIIPVRQIATCLPVLQELLQGIDDNRLFLAARDAMNSFPVVESPLSSEVFLEAVQLYRLARRAGLTVRSSTDCLIAACALRNNLTVVHRDRDFEALAGVSTLRTMVV